MWKLPRRTQQRFRHFKVWHGVDHWGEPSKTGIFAVRSEKERSSCKDTDSGPQ